MRKEGGLKLFFNLKRKTGLSAVVTTLIIILLSIVVIGILWVVVKGVIQSGSEKIELGQYTLGLNIKGVQVQGDNVTVTVVVKRNVGEGDFTAMTFVFSDGKNSETVMQNSSLSELEEQTFTFTLTKINTADLKEVSVAPVFALTSGKDFVGNIVDTYDVEEKGLGSGGTGTGSVVELDNFEKLGYVGRGLAEYEISSTQGDFPQFKNVVINPLDVHLGDNQTFEVLISSSYGVVSIISTTQLDNEILELPLEKISEYGNDSTWSVTWQVYDTHSTTYRTLFTATDSLGNKNSLNMTWTDPCSGLVQGSNSEITAPCTVGTNAVDGLDAGNVTLSNGGSITVDSGSNFIWTPGYSILFSGGSISFSGGSLRKAYLYRQDTDGDNYGSSTFSWNSTPTWSGYVRAKDAGATADCNPNNAYVYRNIAYLAIDNDQDQSTTSYSGTACVGAGPTTINGFEYYKGTSNTYIWAGINQTTNFDCDDTNGYVNQLRNSIGTDWDHDRWYAFGSVADGQCVGYDYLSYEYPNCDYWWTGSDGRCRLISTVNSYGADTNDNCDTCHP